MKRKEKAGRRRWAAAGIIGFAALMLAACNKDDELKNLIQDEEEEEKIVNLFSPMEKTDPDAENVARSAADLTIAMAEEELGVTVTYKTYTAEDYQDKTYDQVTLDRARNNMDDIYLLNPDVVQALGEEGKLMDLSGLECVENLREVIKTANTVDGKLVAIPQ